MKLLNRTILNTPWAMLRTGYGIVTRADRGPRVRHSSPYATAVPKHVREIERRIKHDVVTADLSSGDRLYDLQLWHPRGKHAAGLTILHLSDLHLKRKPRARVDVATHFLKHVVADLIVITGDIVHASDVILEPYMRAFLTAAKARLGKYYVYGDHERKHGAGLANLDKAMGECGFRKLVNANAVVRKGIRLIGLDDVRRGVVDAKKAFKGVREEEYNIVITHNLDALDSSVPPFADLVLWGHLHAGELNLLVADGYGFMRAEGSYRDLNSHRPVKQGHRFLTERTLSYNDPGFYSYFRDARLGRRLNTRRQGFSLLTIQQA